jgi:hypothetical protein
MSVLSLKSNYSLDSMNNLSSLYHDQLYTLSSLTIKNKDDYDYNYGSLKLLTRNNTLSSSFKRSKLIKENDEDDVEYIDLDTSTSNSSCNQQEQQLLKLHTFLNANCNSRMVALTIPISTLVRIFFFLIFLC